MAKFTSGASNATVENFSVIGGDRIQTIVRGAVSNNR